MTQGFLVRFGTAFNCRLALVSDLLIRAELPVNKLYRAP